MGSSRPAHAGCGLSSYRPRWPRRSRCRSFASSRPASAALEGVAIASASKSASRACAAAAPRKLLTPASSPVPEGLSALPPSFRIPNAPQETRALAQLAGATWFGRRLKSGDCQSVKADKFALLCSAKILVDRLLCNAYIRFTTLGSVFSKRAYDAQRFRRVSESG